MSGDGLRQPRAGGSLDPKAKAATGPYRPVPQPPRPDPWEALDTGEGLTGRQLFMSMLPKEGGHLDRSRPRVMALLRSGELYGEGYLAPVDPDGRGRARVPARLWDVLDVHLLDDGASGGGLEYASVLFFKAALTGTAKAVYDARLALIDIMMCEKRDTKDLCFDRAEELDNKLTRRGFDSAWSAALAEPTTHASWHRPGPTK